MPPSTTLGKAIGYTVGQWPKLIRYLESPLLSPDNNACERAIRPFVVGRKNWLLSGSPAGAEASAAWYSLIETAKLNGIEPYLYLCYILSRLPAVTIPRSIDFSCPGASPRSRCWISNRAAWLDPGASQALDPPSERGGVYLTVT